LGKEFHCSLKYGNILLVGHVTLLFDVVAKQNL
jgi:hypothetical protein